MITHGNNFGSPARTIPNGWILLFLLAGIVSLPGVSSAQPDVFVSFGGKIGYTFGSSGEMIGGLEVSVTRWPESRTASGICLSLEQTRSFTMAHLGVELMQGFAGGSLGPSIIFRENDHAAGLTGTVWTGLIVYPYLRSTWLPSTERTVPEFGAFMKFPKLISGAKTFRLGG